MRDYRAQLEASDRPLRLRRMKALVLSLLLALALLLSAYEIATRGASLQPLYLPIDALLPLVLVVLLTGTIAHLAFRALEFRYIRRDSQKYLIARDSIRRASAVVAASAIAAAILLVPWTEQSAEDALTQVLGGTLLPGEEVSYPFDNQDALAITQFRRGQVAVMNCATPCASVNVSSKDGVTPGQVWTARPFNFVIDTAVLERYNVTIRNVAVQSVEYRMELDRVVMPELTSSVPLILLGFAVAYGGWIAYLRPVRRRSESLSIFGTRRVEMMGAGERTFRPRRRRARAPRAARGPGPPAPLPGPAASASAPDLPLPPPPDVPPPPPDVGPPGGVAGVFAEGSRLFGAGDFSGALTKFDEVLATEPTNVRALLARAAALRRTGRRGEALAAYTTALEHDPRGTKALVSRAQILEEDGRWTEASDAWEAYVEVEPDDVDARLRHAEALVRAGDRAGALAALQEAASLAPSDARIMERVEMLTADPAAQLSKAFIASASGNYAEAIAGFERILAVEPDNVNALVGKGVALRRGDRADEALEAFERVLAMQPGNAAALLAKGQILEHQGAYEDALDVYDGLLQSNPRDAEAWALQGDVLRKMGEVDEALASYREALKIDPSNAMWRAKGEALEVSTKGEEAFLEELFEIKGMGPARVRALLAAGYRDAGSLLGATADELAKVRGMTKTLAADLQRHFRKKGSDGSDAGDDDRPSD